MDNVRDNVEFKSIDWNFHVVLYLNDKIYDFDYTSSPAPVSLQTYVDNALRPNDGEENRLSLQSEIFAIEPDDYLVHYEVIRNWLRKIEISRHEAAPHYIRRQTLAHYLTESQRTPLRVLPQHDSQNSQNLLLH
jgi:hypothetical protein